MQPNLTLKNGQTIPLTDEVYEVILRILKTKDETVSPADSIEELEEEFAELFAPNGASASDVVAEHEQELERENRKMELFP
jgi:predicted CopG family antitoxin